MPFLSVCERVSVVVDMGLAQVLGLWILVRLMVMVDGGMAVLMVVSAHHVLPFRPVTMVVNDVSVLMIMHEDVMMMHRHFLTPPRRSLCGRNLARHPGPLTGPKVTSAHGR